MLYIITCKHTIDNYIFNFFPPHKTDRTSKTAKGLLISSLTENSNNSKLYIQFYSWLTYVQVLEEGGGHKLWFYCIMMAWLWMRHYYVYVFMFKIWKLEPTRHTTYKSPWTPNRIASTFIFCYFHYSFNDLHLVLPQNNWHAASLAHSVALYLLTQQDRQRKEKGSRTVSHEK